MLLAFPCGAQTSIAPNAAPPKDATRKAVPAIPPACVAAPEAGHFVKPLLRLARLLANGQPITIVAFGSSSTWGAGASSPAMAYPSRLEAELKRRFPGASIRVLNRGVGGEEAPEMLARLDTSVIAEKPDLVLWQLGSNAVLRDRTIDDLLPVIRQGLARMRDAGIDVVMIDPQYAPRLIAKPDAERMVHLLSTIGKLDSVDTFHRYAAMRYWREVKKVPFEVFVAADGLHLNDWSYACMAKLLAADIIEAATRAPMTAGAVR
jgi:lysophospholipase L1-like esterase